MCGGHHCVQLTGTTRCPVVPEAQTLSHSQTQPLTPSHPQPQPKPQPQPHTEQRAHLPHAEVSALPAGKIHDVLHVCHSCWRKWLHQQLAKKTTTRPTATDVEVELQPVGCEHKRVITAKRKRVHPLHANGVVDKHFLRAERCCWVPHRQANLSSQACNAMSPV